MFFRTLLPGRSRLARAGLVATGLVGVGYGFDTFAYDQTLQRNVRTLYNGAIVTLDYKLNFVPGKVESIDALHERVAARILDVCRRNGGLYIKFGQQLAAVPVLPPSYHKTFKVLFDDAPAVPYDIVRKIIAQDFGKEPEEIFESFAQAPVASASIAQVHRATLKDGTAVAVKIQKPEIQRQIGWDLLTYKFLCRAMEFFFDLPLTWQADYIEQHLRQETDFINEARNAERAAQFIAQAPGNLSERTYVPRVYWDETSKRVMTAEWIDGVRFTNLEEINAKGWSKKQIMRTIVDVFADQIFRSGFIHADPHPGNLIIRPNPITGKTQVVLLDHGLYVQCREGLKHDYAVFWKSMFSGDIATLSKIGESWGIHDIEMFASATLQKPWSADKPVHVDQSVDMENLFQKQLRMKQSVKSFLENSGKFPKELIFVGRNMNLVRANNKYLGSPVNRINVMANYAVQSLGNDWSLWRRDGSAAAAAEGYTTSNRGAEQRTNYSVTDMISSRLNYWTFRTALFLSAVVFHISRALQKLRLVFLGKEGKGFEDLVDGGMKERLESQFGLTIDESVFAG
ncbi:hypothetical protein HDU90_004819 [Geranomyces variabilis]|nr:hypothetical protein HDU90_004819 [Geranomyces variabilis]